MVSAIASRPTTWARHRLLARRALARRPEAWVYAVALAAGSVLLAHTVRSLGNPGASWMVAWGGWMLMVLAMMLPVIAPHARQVAVRSLWHRRHRAMAWYLCGYLAVWAVIGAVIVGALHLVDQPHPPVGVTVAALAVAALWQTSPPRRRAMRRCGNLSLGAVRGAAADRDCAAAGWRAGRRCAFTCGPVMLAMAVGHHHPALMGGLLVLLLTERAAGPNPGRRAGRPLEAWGLIGYAGALTLAAAG